MISTAKVDRDVDMKKFLVVFVVDCCDKKPILRQTTHNLCFFNANRSLDLG